MKMGSSLSDEELINIIANNVNAMQAIINSDGFVVDDDNPEVERIFLETFDACKEAARREIKVENMNFILAVSSYLGYCIENGKLIQKIEFKNGVVDGYYKNHKRKKK